MRVNSNYSAMGEVPEVTGAAKSATDTIIEAIGKTIPLWQQVKIFNAQLKIEKQRAASSGGMIDTSNITVPAIPVQAQLSQQNMMLIAGGIGLLAVILLMKKR